MYQNIIEYQYTYNRVSNYIRENNNTVNIILNSISKGVALLFGNMTNANKTWNVSIARYEENP
jgi:hypothetical protein